MGYNTMDHAAWAAENNKAANEVYKNRRSYRPAPETLTEFQAKVMDICGMVGGGIYNAPINWEKIDWGVSAREGHGRMFVPWRDGRLATFDYFPLTLLVFLCHEARIRGEVRAKSAGHFELSFFERKHEGGMAIRHPNLEEAVLAFRDYLAPDHRIVYRAPAVAEAA